MFGHFRLCMKRLKTRRSHHKILSDIAKWGELRRHLLTELTMETALCKICSKLIKTPERRRSGVFIVNFEQILLIVLVFQSLTLSN